MQVSAAILLLVTCYLPLVVYLHPSQQSIQTTARNIPPPFSRCWCWIAVVWCLVTVYTISKNSVYNRQNAPSILQMLQTISLDERVYQDVGQRYLCVIKSSTINHQIYKKNQCIFMAYPTKISSILWLFLWLTLPKHHQYCDYQILISLCSFLNQMAPENDEMKFQKL